MLLFHWFLEMWKCFHFIDFSKCGNGSILLIFRWESISSSFLGTLSLSIKVVFWISPSELKTSLTSLYFGNRSIRLWSIYSQNIETAMLSSSLLNTPNTWEIYPNEGGGNGAVGREILDFRFVTLASLLLDTAPQLIPRIPCILPDGLHCTLLGWPYPLSLCTLVVPHLPWMRRLVLKKLHT